jgi:hypothetical protein
MKIEKNRKIRGVAKALAPEDIACGDYLIATRVDVELVPCPDADSVRTGGVGVVRLSLTPWNLGPWRVLAVNLPAVLVEDVKGAREIMDSRRWRFARVAPAFGKRAFKAIGKKGGEV